MALGVAFAQATGQLRTEYIQLSNAFLAGCALNGGGYEVTLTPQQTQLLAQAVEHAVGSGFPTEYNGWMREVQKVLATQTGQSVGASG